MRSSLVRAKYTTGDLQHIGDMAAQIDLSMDNVVAMLGEAGMSLSDLVPLNVYATDVA